MGLASILVYTLGINGKKMCRRCFHVLATLAVACDPATHLALDGPYVSRIGAVACGTRYTGYSVTGLHDPYMSSGGMFMSEVGQKMSTRWGYLMSVKRLHLGLVNEIVGTEIIKGDAQDETYFILLTSVFSEETGDKYLISRHDSVDIRRLSGIYTSPFSTCSKCHQLVE
jgi:hypothetical protein